MYGALAANRWHAVQPKAASSSLAVAARHAVSHEPSHSVFMQCQVAGRRTWRGTPEP